MLLWAVTSSDRVGRIGLGGLGVVLQHLRVVAGVLVDRADVLSAMAWLRGCAGLAEDAVGGLEALQRRLDLALGRLQPGLGHQSGRRAAWCSGAWAATVARPSAITGAASSRRFRRSSASPCSHWAVAMCSACLGSPAWRWAAVRASVERCERDLRIGHHGDLGGRRRGLRSWRRRRRGRRPRARAAAGDRQEDRRRPPRRPVVSKSWRRALTHLAPRLRRRPLKLSLRGDGVSLRLETRPGSGRRRCSSGPRPVRARLSTRPKKATSPSPPDDGQRVERLARQAALAGDVDALGHDAELAGLAVDDLHALEVQAAASRRTSAGETLSCSRSPPLNRSLRGRPTSKDEVVRPSCRPPAPDRRRPGGSCPSCRWP